MESILVLLSHPLDNGPPGSLGVEALESKRMIWSVSVSQIPVRKSGCTCSPKF
jgi:hypothetical protein